VRARRKSQTPPPPPPPLRPTSSLAAAVTSTDLENQEPYLIPEEEKCRAPHVYLVLKDEVYDDARTAVEDDDTYLQPREEGTYEEGAEGNCDYLEPTDSTYQN